jgi:hypothetical protein
MRNSNSQIENINIINSLYFLDSLKDDFLFGRSKHHLKVFLQKMNPDPTELRYKTGIIDGQQTENNNYAHEKQLASIDFDADSINDFISLGKYKNFDIHPGKFAWRGNYDLYRKMLSYDTYSSFIGIPQFSSIEQEEMTEDQRVQHMIIQYQSCRRINDLIKKKYVISKIRNPSYQNKKTYALDKMFKYIQDCYPNYSEENIIKEIYKINRFSEDSFIKNIKSVLEDEYPDFNLNVSDDELLKELDFDPKDLDELKRLYELPDYLRTKKQELKDYENVKILNKK